MDAGRAQRPLGLAFADLARGYCAWCEQGSFVDADREAASWVAELYAAALTLPEVEPDNEDGLPELPAADLATAVVNLACFNGQYYREVFDPDPTLLDEAVMGDIGDDLLDIYKDLKAGLVLFDQDQLAEALWFWSFLHRIHWGRHAAGALMGLHGLVISRRD